MGLLWKLWRRRSQDWAMKEGCHGSPTCGVFRGATGFRIPGPDGIPLLCQWQPFKIQDFPRASRPSPESSLSKHRQQLTPHRVLTSDHWSYTKRWPCTIYNQSGGITLCTWWQRYKRSFSPPKTSSSPVKYRHSPAGRIATGGAEGRRIANRT